MSDLPTPRNYVARQSRNRTGKADRKIEDRKMGCVLMFLSSIFLSLHVLPHALTSSKLPRSLRRISTIAVQGSAQVKPTQSHLRAACKPFARGRLGCCLRILFVFSWCSHGILFVFCSCNPPTAQGAMRGFDSGGLAAIQTGWDLPMSLRPSSRPSRPLRETIRLAGSRTQTPPTTHRD